jgi:hypothetical protein
MLVSGWFYGPVLLFVTRTPREKLETPSDYKLVALAKGAELSEKLRIIKEDLLRMSRSQA